MAELGKINHLTVLKVLDFGVYLDGDELGEILLPNCYVPEACLVNQVLKVFIYLDSDDTIIATTVMPLALVGQCAAMRVIAINHYGTFVDWGLSKDLLVPYSEQYKALAVGQSYVFHLFLDEQTDRIAASAKLNNFLSEEAENLEVGEHVNLLICGCSDMGYKAVINQSYLGLIFSNEIFQPLHIGQQLKGLIKHIRDDGKIDLSLQVSAEKTRDQLSQRIIDFLGAQGGTSDLTDKSPPEAIYQQFGVSKGSYKKALGQLFKQKLILVEKTKITLL